MTKAMEFRGRAEQYRELAAQFPDQKFRGIIFSMAAMWETLADDRERFLPNRVADHAAIQPKT